MVSCLGSLVQSRWGEGGVLQADIAVCGEQSQCFGHSGFAPLTGVCSPRLHCSGAWLLYTEQALLCIQFQFSGTPQKRGLGWTWVLCLPRPSSSGSQELDGRTLPGCSAPSPLHGLSLSFCRHQSVLRLVSVLGSWPLATTLLADVGHPESQEVFG